MWCKNCNIETNEEKCPICGEKTVEDYPTEVYWCDNCRVPVMQEVNQADNRCKQSQVEKDIIIICNKGLV